MAKFLKRNGYYKNGSGKPTSERERKMSQLPDFTVIIIKNLVLAVVLYHIG